MWAAFASVHDIPNGNVVLYHQPSLFADVKLGVTSESIGRVGYSEDGRNWKYLRLTGCDNPSQPSTKSVTSVAYSESECAIYAAAFEDGIYRADDEGTDEFVWKRISQDFDNRPNRRFWRLVAHRDGSIFALITARTVQICGEIDFDMRNHGVGVYRRARNSSRWDRLGQSDDFTLRWPRDIAVDTNNSERVFVAASEPSALRKLDWNNETIPPIESGVYQWQASEDTWRRLPLSGMPMEFRHFSVYIHPRRPDWLYLTLEGEIGGIVREHSGLWLSKDGGETCEQFKEFPFMNVHRVWISPNDPNTMYVSTNGAGVWKGPADPEDEDVYHAVRR